MTTLLPLVIVTSYTQQGWEIVPAENKKNYGRRQEVQ